MPRVKSAETASKTEHAHDALVEDMLHQGLFAASPSWMLVTCGDPKWLLQGRQEL